MALFISAIMREQQRALALDSKHEENKAGGCLIPFFWGTLVGNQQEGPLKWLVPFGLQGHPCGTGKPTKTHRPANAQPYFSFGCLKDLG